MTDNERELLLYLARRAQDTYWIADSGNQILTKLTRQVEQEANAPVDQTEDDGDSWDRIPGL